MNFQLKHRGVDCPAELERMIEAKVAKIARLLPESSFIEVELAVEVKGHRPGHQRAEIVADIPGQSGVIRLQEYGETFQEAVDRVLDRLDQVVKQVKDKQKNRHPRGNSPKEWLVGE